MSSTDRFQLIDRTRSKTSASEKSGANLRFGVKLWHAAAKLRKNVDAAAHKDLILCSIFCKFIPETFENPCARLVGIMSRPFDMNWGGRSGWAEHATWCCCSLEGFGRAPVS